MYTLKTILIVAIVLLAVAATPCHANGMETLDLPISLTGEVTHTFYLDPGERGGPSGLGDLGDLGGRVVDQIGIQFAPFTVDLRELTGMTSTFEAPAGQRYFVDPPTGVSTELMLQFNYLTGGAAGQTEHWPHTITLLNVQGVAPTELFTQARGRVEGVQIFTQAEYQVNGPFSFTGLALSIDGPFRSAGIETYTRSGGSFWIGFSSDTDTGQFVTVIPGPAFQLGDMDGSDGATEPNGNDINPFVLALVDRPAYEDAFPGLDADARGNCAQDDGLLNGNDILPFVDLIVGSQTIPEPATLLVMTAAGIPLLLKRRRNA